MHKGTMLAAACVLMAAPVAGQVSCSRYSHAMLVSVSSNCEQVYLIDYAECDDGTRYLLSYRTLGYPRCIQYKT